MSEHESLEPDRLETALRQLTPTPPTFDKDRLLFRAGRAAGRRAYRRLALLAALLGIGIGMAGTYLGMHALMPEKSPQVRVILVPVPAPSVEAPSPRPPEEQPSQKSVPAATERSSFSEAFFSSAGPANGYLQLRGLALRWGVEALPTAPPAATDGPAPQATNLLKMQSEWIGKASEF
jgi:hypothetical protein